MSKPKQQTSLSWDDFVKLGDPNAVIETENETTDTGNNKATMPIRVHYEKKGRGGKEACIVRGFDGVDESSLEKLCKTIKSALGIGGSLKDNELLFQGNKRDKIMEILVKEGYKQVKKAGG